MAVPILVLTPNPGFGELICQILEEAGGYTLALTTNKNDAFNVSRKDSPSLCIVDGDLAEDIPQVVSELRQIVDGLLVVFIPQDETTEELEAQVNADGYLAKPFYLPDLVTTVDEVARKIDSDSQENNSSLDVGQSPIESEESMVDINNAGTVGVEVEGPDWLKEVETAAQYLASLSLESSSQASLITRSGKIWAYAGELPQPAVQELAETVSKYYSVDAKSDLARFIHLEATGGEYMLYATGIEGDFVLAMVFNAEMPFSKIRTQAGKLAKALTESPRNSTNPVELEDNSLSEWDDSIETMNEFDSEMSLLDDVPPPIPTDWMPAEEVSEGRKSFLEDLLENDVLADSPVASNFTTEPHTRAKPDIGVESIGVDLAYDEEEYGNVDIDHGLGDVTVPSSGGIPKTPVNPEETMVSASLSTKEKGTEETIETDLPYESKEIKLEPVSPSVYNLTYACVLIPRLPNHHLTGVIASNVSEWITQLSLAFGWRLEHLSIRPEYLQWLINVPPATSPGYLMRIVRQHTSRRMFVEFPKMGDENPSGDFWAPGYLIMSGDQPPPPQLVKDFIQDTRRRQGITR